MLNIKKEKNILFDMPHCLQNTFNRKGSSKFEEFQAKNVSLINYSENV